MRRVVNSGYPYNVLEYLIKSKRVGDIDSKYTDLNKLLCTKEQLTQFIENIAIRVRPKDGIDIIHALFIEGVSISELATRMERSRERVYQLLTKFLRVLKSRLSYLFEEPKIVSGDTGIKLLDLGLSAASYNPIRRSGFITLEDVYTNQAELLYIRGFGKAGAEDLVSKAENVGVYLDIIKMFLIDSRFLAVLKGKKYRDLVNDARQIRSANMGLLQSISRDEIFNLSFKSLKLSYDITYLVDCVTRLNIGTLSSLCREIRNDFRNTGNLYYNTSTRVRGCLTLASIYMALNLDYNLNLNAIERRF